MVSRQLLMSSLNSYLAPDDVRDFCPNGLQVQGAASISKLVTGVTASQALIEQAIEVNADTILVHHGYFWKGESQTITGMKYQRIKQLLANDINLIAYHLPLDVHPECGNNVQLGHILGIDKLTPLAGLKPTGIVYTGELATPFAPKDMQKRIQYALGRDVLWVGGEKPIRTVAWCTGGGQSYIDAAIEAGVDAFISGEVSEQTVHSAREMGIHFFSAGHHATERYGVKALGEWLAGQHDVDVEFIDVPNPA